MDLLSSNSMEYLFIDSMLCQLYSSFYIMSIIRVLCFKRSRNNWAGLGCTLIDSLDTLWLMGMKDEFYRARDWVKSSLNFNKSQRVCEQSSNRVGSKSETSEY